MREIMWLLLFVFSAWSVWAYFHNAEERRDMKSMRVLGPVSLFIQTSLCLMLTS
jgi:hypothetical protein